MGIRRTRRRVVLLALVIAIGVAAIVAPRTGWLSPRPHYAAIPECTELFNAGIVDAAVQSTFTTLWPKHRTSFSSLGGWMSSCTISALSLDIPTPPPGSPSARNLSVTVTLFREEWTSARSPLFLRGGVREARERFAQMTSGDCYQSSSPETGLGEAAASCLDEPTDSWPSQQVVFRDSNLIVEVQLAGDNYGEHASLLRDDLRASARCVAEAVGLRLEVPIAERHTCGADAALA